MEEVTLYDVLDFRDKKAEMQRQMLKEASEGVVVSLGMNIPGPVKRSADILRAFTEGVEEVREILQSQGEIQKEIVLEEPGGYAAIFLVSKAEGMKVKKAVVELEENHLLGRIFDVDVLEQSGMALTRQMVGTKGRKCLLCGSDAKVCGRNRTHSAEELQKAVFDMIESWIIMQEA